MFYLIRILSMSFYKLFCRLAYNQRVTHQTLLTARVETIITTGHRSDLEKNTDLNAASSERKSRHL